MSLQVFEIELIHCGPFIGTIYVNIFFKNKLFMIILTISGTVSQQQAHDVV